MAGNRKLRVLWVTPTIGPDFGGPTSTVRNGLIAENRAGLDSELISTVGGQETRDSVPAAAELEAAGVEVRLFQRSRLLGRGEAWGLSLPLVWWLARNVRKYDVVHLQYVWCLTSIAGAILSRLAGIPLVMTPHESLTAFDTEVASRHPLLKLMKRLIRPLYMRSVDRLILMSGLEQRDTDAGHIPVRIVSHAVLEEPVEEKPAGPAAGDHLRIAFIGRNIEKKGLHLLLEAIALSPEGRRHLTIAGPPPTEEYRAWLEAIISEHGLREQVEWAGYVDDREGYLRAASVLAMPSAYEGFGMVAAEAMCCGVPVVVPENSGVAEIVTEFDAGVVMPESTASALDAAFTVFEQDHRLAAEKGANGLEAANARLTFDAFAAGTKRVYLELIQA